MRTIHVIGIGAGDPDYVTAQAVGALNSTDVFFAMDKGEHKSDLVALRRTICERFITRPDYRFVELADPKRAGEGDYLQAVSDRRFKQGAQEIPGQLAGLADVVPALAFNARPFTTAANAIGEATGFQPGKWAKETQAQLSPEARASQQEIAKVWDDPNSTPLEVAGAYVANPAYSANQVMRSVPGMLAGGLGSRALMKAGAVAETATAAAVPGHLERLVGQKMAAPIAGGIGEGAQQSGQQMVEYSILMYGIAFAGMGPMVAIGPLFLNAMESYVVDVLFTIALASP